MATRMSEVKTKAVSELGGTSSLYVSFTLMSLFETLAFLFSRDVRRDVDRYEILLEERRNPSILTPVPFWKRKEHPQTSGDQ
ncbi:hypothetical protein M3Y99_00333500 [Aphelenchoides fujianensis]|nr:hypothetical protein M3Y99_00333500 [Aphelenchoides fujianensis]